MKEILLGIILGIQAGWDLKYKEIPFIISLSGVIVGVIFCILEERAWISLLISCIPGMLALVISKLTNEMIGYGDGILLVLMGIFLPVERLIAIGMLSFSIAGLFALILLIILHKKGSDRIPFVPFLAFAYWLEYLIEMGGIG